MKFVVVAAGAVLAFYSLLCVLLPEVRPYHKGFRKKFGVSASLGLALFFWFPALAYAGKVMGLISADSRPFVWLIFCLLMLVAIIGSWVECLSD